MHIIIGCNPFTNFASRMTQIAHMNNERNLCIEIRMIIVWILEVGRVVLIRRLNVGEKWLNEFCKSLRDENKEY